MYILKWINKFSKETGYVGKVMKSKGYFENTFDINAAKKYRTENEAKKDITLLDIMGESQNNDFLIINKEDSLWTAKAPKRRKEIYCPRCLNELIKKGNKYVCSYCYITYTKSNPNILINKLWHNKTFNKAVMVLWKK